MNTRHRVEEGKCRWEETAFYANAGGEISAAVRAYPAEVGCPTHYGLFFYLYLK